MSVKPEPDLYIPRAENPSGFARFLVKASGEPALLKNTARNYEHGQWLLAGTLLGLACVVATGYVFRSRFYGVHSTSIFVLVGSTLLLVIPALLAIALPARHASLQDPANTLRRE
jgi:hypothetical protein